MDVDPIRLLADLPVACFVIGNSFVCVQHHPGIASEGAHRRQLSTGFPTRLTLACVRLLLKCACVWLERTGLNEFPPGSLLLLADSTTIY